MINVSCESCSISSPVQESDRVPLCVLTFLFSSAAVKSYIYMHGIRICHLGPEQGSCHHGE